MIQSRSAGSGLGQEQESPAGSWEGPTLQPHQDGDHATEGKSLGAVPLFLPRARYLAVPPWPWSSAHTACSLVLCSGPPPPAFLGLFVSPQSLSLLGPSPRPSRPPCEILVGRDGPHSAWLEWYLRRRGAFVFQMSLAAPALLVLLKEALVPGGGVGMGWVNLDPSCFFGLSLKG